MEARRTSCFEIKLAHIKANFIQHWPKHLWPVVGAVFLQMVNFMKASISLEIEAIP